MLAGMPYHAMDAELVAARHRCRAMLRELNHAAPLMDLGPLIRRLFGAAGEGTNLTPPFFCDYGSNIRVGARFFANFNCVILDPASVEIGDDVQFGPAVQIYTAGHPVDAAERARGAEWARPVRIGGRVWIGGGAIVLPGVTIGDDTTIAAGAVVTRDVPPRVLAGGVPCRVGRKLS